MTAFADLHKPGDPLVLPNAWDHASAAALAEAGFPAIGTTSLGVAAALGLPDGAAETAEATIDLARRLTHLPVPITMDIENGFSHDPAEVAAYVDRLGPVAGVNLEDQLADPRHFAQVLVAVTGHEVFINARIDTYWLGDGGVDATLERAEALHRTPAPTASSSPASRTRREIARLAEALAVPLNVLFLPGMLPSPGWPSSASPASAPARCSTASPSAPPSTPRPPSGTEAVVHGAPPYAAVDGLAKGTVP